MHALKLIDSIISNLFGSVASVPFHVLQCFAVFNGSRRRPATARTRAARL
jgi:hypothetical protein